MVRAFPNLRFAVLSIRRVNPRAGWRIRSPVHGPRRFRRLVSCTTPECAAVALTL
jgi:hypothetical protein